MPIQSGSPNGSNEVMNAFGSNFNDTAQMIFNSDYLGFDSRLNSNGTPSLKNLDYDTFTSDSMTITGNINYDSTNDWYFGPTEVTEAEFVEYDDCNNSSIDTGKWTATLNPDGETATNTENGVYQEVVAAALVDGGDPSAVIVSNSLDMDTYSFIMIDLPQVFATSNNTLKDPTASVQFGGQTMVVSAVTSSGTVDKVDYKIQLLKIKTNLYYYRVFDSSTWGSWTSIAPSSEVISFNTAVGTATNSGQATARIRFNLIRYNTLATSLASTTDYITSDTVTTETNTNAISVVNSTNPDGGSTPIKLSANSGVNYEDVTNTEIHRFSNTGTGLKIRILNKGVNTITEFATKYNFY